MQKINSSTVYRKELHRRILDTAMMLFRERGVRAVKMDDIASHLSISKRTLYEIYDNKEDLLLEGLRVSGEGERNELSVYAESHRDVMQILLHFYRLRFSELGVINPLFFTDLHRYRKVEDYFQSRHAEQKEQTLKFFRRGVDEGYFLPQLNYDIVLRLGEASLDYVMATKMYEEFSLQEIFRNFVSVLLRGYCTEKGQRILDESL